MSRRNIYSQWLGAKPKAGEVWCVWRRMRLSDGRRVWHPCIEWNRKEADAYCKFLRSHEPDDGAYVGRITIKPEAAK